MMCRALIGLQEIKKTPLQPPLQERGEVLETVCLSNQVMMSENICELQGVSR